MESITHKSAKSVFDLLVATFNDKEFKFYTDEERMAVCLQLATDDLPIALVAEVDETRQLLRMVSVFPFQFPKERRIEGAIAAGMTNFHLFTGSFDYDYTEGNIKFRLTSSFFNSVISRDVILSMLGRTFTTCDEYNDKLCNLANGKMSLSQYLDLFDED